MTSTPEPTHPFSLFLTQNQTQELLRYLFDDILQLRRELVTTKAQKDSYRDLLKELGIDREDDERWYNKFDEIKKLVNKVKS